MWSLGSEWRDIAGRRLPRFACLMHGKIIDKSIYTPHHHVHIRGQQFRNFAIITPPPTTTSTMTAALSRVQTASRHRASPLFAQRVSAAFARKSSHISQHTFRNCIMRNGSALDSRRAATFRRSNKTPSKLLVFGEFAYAVCDAGRMRVHDDDDDCQAAAGWLAGWPGENVCVVRWLVSSAMQC